MAHKFNDSEKEVKEFADRLAFGTHKVQLVLAEAGATDEGKEYIEVMFATQDGIEDKARVWFVGGAGNISFNTLRQIIVHNAKTDAAKDKAREAVDKCQDTEELVQLLNEKCIGGEMWVSKYYDPTRTYQSKDGVTRRSINVNIYGYEPKPKPHTLMPAPTPAELVERHMPGAKEVPFASEGDAPGSTVPSDDAWAE